MINNRKCKQKFHFNHVPYAPISELDSKHGNGYHLLDHWNSISKFLEGPLLLSGNRVYSPDTAPSITTRSICIVTFPNELCHQWRTIECITPLYNILTLTNHVTTLSFNMKTTQNIESHAYTAITRTHILVSMLMGGCWWVKETPKKIIRGWELRNDNILYLKIIYSTHGLVGWLGKGNDLFRTLFSLPTIFLSYMQ